MDHDERSRPLVPYDSRERPNRADRAKRDSNESKADQSNDDSVRQGRFRSDVNRSDPKLLAWEADVKPVTYTSPGRKMFQGRNTSSDLFEIRLHQ